MLIPSLSSEIFKGNIPALLRYVCSGAQGPFPAFVPGENPPVMATLYLYVDELCSGLVPQSLLSSPGLQRIATSMTKDNLRLAGSLCQMADYLRSKGIECMPIKGGAVKALLPGIPRPMADMDLLVRNIDFRKSVRCASELGYTYKMDVHSADIFGDDKSKNVLDIHRFVMMGTGKERCINDDLFSRARHGDAFGSDVLLPCAEDLVFILMVNAARNIGDNKNDGGVALSVMDIHYLTSTKSDFDWNIVVEDARKSGSGALVRFVSELYETVAPGMIPSFSELCTDEDYEDYQARIRFKRYFLVPLQIRSHELGVSEVLRHPSRIPSFLKIRPKYTFLKLLRNNTKFAALYMKNHTI